MTSFFSLFLSWVKFGFYDLVVKHQNFDRVYRETSLVELLGYGNRGFTDKITLKIYLMYGFGASW